jgi:hypothetical protein
VGSVPDSVPWLWAYWPRRKVALEGQHEGVVTNACSKRTPSSTRRFWTLSILVSECGSWSSIRTKSMLGLVEASASRKEVLPTKQTARHKKTRTAKSA